MLDHLGHGPITAADQALAKRVAIHPLAGAEQERVAFECVFRTNLITDSGAN